MIYVYTYVIREVWLCLPYGWKAHHYYPLPLLAYLMSLDLMHGCLIILLSHREPESSTGTNNA